MEKFAVDQSGNGKSLVRVILAHDPDLSAGCIFQALRKKDIRLNGIRQHTDCVVQAGDEITLYLPEDARIVTGHPSRAESRLSAGESGERAYYKVIYEDPLILIVNKKPGIDVQPGQDGQSSESDLRSVIRREFLENSIELCHRLDRQTGGLLILARKPEGLAAVRDLLMAGGIVKRYRCLVRGRPSAGSPVTCHDGAEMLEISAWLEKDASHSLVHVHDQKQPGDLPIVTRYRIASLYKKAGPDQEDVSLVEVEMVTGRTHQIRAHFAAIGNPLVGDGKYGRNDYNRFFRGSAGPVGRQQLYATQLLFLPENKGPLAYLAGRTFMIEPDFDWKPM